MRYAELKPLARVDVLDRGRAGELQRERGVDALEDEERRERDDEARQLRPHHRVAVEEPDGERRTRARARSPARCSCPRASRGSRAAGPELPIITPAERSNSPPIISSATGTATIPYCAAWSVQPAAIPGSPIQLTARAKYAEREPDDDGADHRADVRAARGASRAGRRGRAARRSSRVGRWLLRPSASVLRPRRAGGRAPPARVVFVLARALGARASRPASRSPC